MKMIGLTGWSGSGKTTLLLELVPLLLARGLRVSTMKHASEHFNIDTPGKDSYRHREAGASEVLISSGTRWALIHELRGAPEPTLEELIAHITPVDLLLIEGFKTHAHDKIEVYRAALGKPMRWPEDANIVAVASDVEIDGSLPRLDLNNPASVVDFILRHTALDSFRN